MRLKAGEKNTEIPVCEGLEMDVGLWEVGRVGIAGSQGRQCGVQRGKEKGIEGSRGWMVQDLKGCGEMFGFNSNYNGKPLSSFLEKCIHCIMI